MKTYLIACLGFLSLAVPAHAIPVVAVPDLGGTVGMLALAVVAAFALRRHLRK